MKQCKTCGAPLPEDAMFCPVCETELMEKKLLRVPRPRRRRRVLALVLALALLSGAFWMLRPRHTPQVYNAGSPPAEMIYTAGDGVTYRLFLSFAGAEEETEPCEQIRLSLPESGEGEIVSLLCAVPEGGTPEDGAAFAALVEHAEIIAAPLQHADPMEHGEAAYDPAHPFAVSAVTLRYHRHTALNELGWVLYMKNGDVIYLHQLLSVETGARVYNAGAPALEMRYTAEDGVSYRLFLSFAQTEEEAQPDQWILLPLPESGAGQLVSHLCAQPEGGTLRDGAAFTDLIRYVDIQVGDMQAATSLFCKDVPFAPDCPFAAAAATVPYDAGWQENELCWGIHMKNGDTLYMHHFVYIGVAAP